MGGLTNEGKGREFEEAVARVIRDAGGTVIAANRGDGDPGSLFGMDRTRLVTGVRLRGLMDSKEVDGVLFVDGEKWVIECKSQAETGSAEDKPAWDMVNAVGYPQEWCSRFILALAGDGWRGSRVRGFHALAEWLSTVNPQRSWAVVGVDELREEIRKAAVS